MIGSRTLIFQQPVVQSQGSIVSEMDGEIVMMNIEHGKYYNLGSIGGRIWELMEAPISAEQMVVTLMAEYEVGQNQCEEQVGAFLENLLSEGLIRYCQS